MAVFDGKTQERILPSKVEPVALTSTVPKLKLKTKISTGGSKSQNLIGSAIRSKDTLKKWKNIYENGGIESQILELYALYILANGYRFEGENPSLVQKCQDFTNSFDFDDCLYKAIIDVGWAGSAFQEIVAGRLNTVRLEEIKKNISSMTPVQLKQEVTLAAIQGGDILAIIPREAESFDIDWDDTGLITGYKQEVVIGGSKQIIQLKPEQIIHIKFFGTGGSIYGLSMYQRAFDEIMRDTKTAEASAQAIDRHGFKKVHITVGQPGETIPQETIDTISSEFENITYNNEFTTTADIGIKNIDEGGLDKVEDYNDISIMRMCAGLGVPEEIAGLRRGSTDATAVERIKIFLKKISFMQKRLAKIYNVNIFDRITGTPGSVKMMFNDVDPSDEIANSGWISKLMLATPDNPFSILPVDYIQGRLGIVPKTNNTESKLEMKSKTNVV